MRIHFAGAGGCVEYIARRLIREGHDLSILDRDETRVQELGSRLDALVACGDAMKLADWRSTGLEQSDLFVACTSSDETNILATLVADRMAPQARKALRLRTAEHADWSAMLKALGVRVDRVIHPEQDVLRRILRVLSVPRVSDIREFVEGRIKVFELNVESASFLAGRTLQELRQAGLLTRMRLCFVFRGTRVILPVETTSLFPGDHVFILTLAEHLDEVLRALGVVEKRQEGAGVFIVGGGELGLELARALEQGKVPVKLFETSPERCEYLANELQTAIVLNRDGTNPETLVSENVEDIAAYIPLTGNDEANLIAALLARRLRVGKVIPLLNRIDLLPVAHQLGVSTCVSPRVKAADALLEFIRRGGVVSVRTLGDEHAEAIELLVPADSSYAGKTLAQLDLPKGCLLGAMVRSDGEALLPEADDLIGVGDRLVFFAKEDAVRELENRVLA